MTHLPAIGKCSEADYEAISKIHSNKITRERLGVGADHDVGNFCCVLFDDEWLAFPNDVHNQTRSYFSVAPGFLDRSARALNLSGIEDSLLNARQFWKRGTL